MTGKRIPGILAYYHDSAAALVVDGEIVAAAQEERFTRLKHDHNFPKNVIDYCLQEGGVTRFKLQGFQKKWSLLTSAATVLKEVQAQAVLL